MGNALTANNSTSLDLVLEKLYQDRGYDFRDYKHGTITRRLARRLHATGTTTYPEYIQFLDGSEVMGIGVNTKNVMRFMRPVNEWNEATEKQSRDRVFREDGHDAIRNQMANEEEEKTGIRPDPYKMDLSVDVYNMCAFVRFFYMSSNFMKYFPESYKSETTTPFRLYETYTNKVKTPNHK